MAFSVTRFGDGEQIISTVVNRPIDEIVTFLNNETGGSFSVTKYNAGDDISADIMNVPLIQIRDHLNGLAQCSGPLVLDLYVDGEDVTAANLNRPIDQIVQFINNECSFEVEVTPPSYTLGDFGGTTIAASVEDGFYNLPYAVDSDIHSNTRIFKIYKIDFTTHSTISTTFSGEDINLASDPFTDVVTKASYATSTYLQQTYEAILPADLLRIYFSVSTIGQPPMKTDGTYLYFLGVGVFDYTVTHAHEKYKFVLIKQNISTNKIEWVTELWGVYSIPTQDLTTMLHYTYLEINTSKDTCVVSSYTGIGDVSLASGSLNWSSSYSESNADGWYSSVGGVINNYPSIGYVDIGGILIREVPYLFLDPNKIIDPYTILLKNNPTLMQNDKPLNGSFIAVHYNDKYIYIQRNSSFELRYQILKNDGYTEAIKDVQNSYDPSVTYSVIAANYNDNTGKLVLLIQATGTGVSVWHISPESGVVSDSTIITEATNTVSSVRNLRPDISKDFIAASFYSTERKTLTIDMR